LAFIKRGRERHIMAACPTLELPDGSVGLDYDITLTEAEGAQSLNIATSWKENRKAFYLNEKINCLKATGTIRRGMETEQLLLGEAWGFSIGEEAGGPTRTHGIGQVPPACLRTFRSA
jgi:hypothetical protein